MPTDYFNERIGARYDETSADLFDPSTVDPAVDFLAGLAGDGVALETTPFRESQLETAGEDGRTG